MLPRRALLVASLLAFVLGCSGSADVEPGSGGAAAGDASGGGGGAGGAGGSAGAGGEEEPLLQPPTPQPVPLQGDVACEDRPEACTDASDASAAEPVLLKVGESCFLQCNWTLEVTVDASGCASEVFFNHLHNQAKETACLAAALTEHRYGCAAGMVLTVHGGEPCWGGP